MNFLSSGLVCALFELWAVLNTNDQCQQGGIREHERSEDETAQWVLFAEKLMEGRGGWVAPSRSSLIQDQNPKLSCFDRLLHEGECAAFRVSTSGPNREVHKTFPMSEVWVLKDVMYAGYRRILRRNTVGRSRRMKKRWAGSRSKGLAVFSHRLWPWSHYFSLHVATLSVALWPHSLLILSLRGYGGRGIFMCNSVGNLHSFNSLKRNLVHVWKFKIHLPLDQHLLFWICSIEIKTTGYKDNVLGRLWRYFFVMEKKN